MVKLIELNFGLKLINAEGKYYLLNHETDDIIKLGRSQKNNESRRNNEKRCWY